MSEPGDAGPTALRPREPRLAEPEPTASGAGSDTIVPPAVRRLAALAGSTTVLTGLLFYFGSSRAYYFYDYLGVDTSLLNMTTRDYLQLSVDGLFVPILVAGVSGLVLLWAHYRFGSTLAEARGARHVSLVLCGVGVLLMLNALSRVYVQTPLNRALAVAPLSLGIGAWLFFYGMRLQRQATASAGGRTTWTTTGEWLALLALVGLALFWVANDYSAEVGTQRARQFVAELPSLPNTQLYSAHDLSLSAPGVQETRCRSADAAYRYRYDGLKLVLQSGDEYLLLPSQWSRGNGVAILLPRSDDVRLQFSPAGVPTDAGAPC